MCLPEREYSRSPLGFFADHIREPYRVFLCRPRPFDAPINAEYAHLLLELRSAICMWPYAFLLYSPLYDAAHQALESFVADGVFAESSRVVQALRGASVRYAL